MVRTLLLIPDTMDFAAKEKPRPSSTAPPSARKTRIGPEEDATRVQFKKHVGASIIVNFSLLSVVFVCLPVAPSSPIPSHSSVESLVSGQQRRNRPLVRSYSGNFIRF